VAVTQKLHCLTHLALAAPAAAARAQAVRSLRPDLPLAYCNQVVNAESNNFHFKVDRWLDSKCQLQPSSAGAESLRFKLHNSRKMLLQPGFYYDYDCDYDCDYGYYDNNQY
jgi:hypothetical protein